MAASEINDFLSHLDAQLNRMPGRAPMGELLEHARTIPLQWNAHEFPATRNLPDQFKQALMPWGAQVQLLKSRDEVMPAIRKIIHDANAKRISRWNTPFLDAFDWNDGLAELDLQWILPSPTAAALDETQTREALLQLETIDVGITDCEWAVAHTGSLLCRHDATRSGYTSLFPWTYIALVPIERILRDLPEAMTKISEAVAANPIGAKFTFITGPSRSGDIDMVAGQGAAGPGKMHILLIESHPSA